MPIKYYINYVSIFRRFFTLYLNINVGKGEMPLRSIIIKNIKIETD